MKSVKGKVWLIVLITLLAASCKKENSSPLIKETITTHPLNSNADLDPLLQQIGDARIVLLGEASHGTSEYYQWRAEISKRLMQEKGFSAIAVEGEWADSYRLNNFIKGPAKDSIEAVKVLTQYDRWPTWMWGNYEVASLATWMNRFNQNRSQQQRVGFYGLDVYCLWESTQELMPYLQGGNQQAIDAARQVETCFRPYSADPQEYGYAVANASANCRTQTTNLWNAILQTTGNATATNEVHFVMQQNALVALNGEAYYRTSVSSYEDSWNIRDRHMQQTLKRLVEHLGPNSKIIVWAHNTHVGDARYTDMAAQGTVNLGQLAREEFGQQNVFAVGFGSYEGSVIASSQWGGTIQQMPVPAAPLNSWEGYLHSIGANNKLILSSEISGIAALQKQVGHRAIGVVYNPSAESGNYVPSIISKRYDAFLYIDRTSALHPIQIPVRNEPPDTYPSGF
ncbi:MAG: protein-L-isoaspartate O-methyltransferase [Flavisolibacter sp.]|jgi:erythromycin esterase-like protein|nr:protein-L-isoaspartate O-methyltransferase [Flavisolibacter sp.]